MKILSTNSSHDDTFIFGSENYNYVYHTGCLFSNLEGCVFMEWDNFSMFLPDEIKQQQYFR